MKHFLTNRKQRVVLNGQSSSWTNVKVAVPQGAIPGPLLFSIHINDLADGLSSNNKLFDDDTSLFSRYSWLSNHDNNNNVSQAWSQKHLGLTLDNRLRFEEHLTNVSDKISKTIELLLKSYQGQHFLQYTNVS